MMYFRAINSRWCIKVHALLHYCVHLVHTVQYAPFALYSHKLSKNHQSAQSADDMCTLCTHCTQCTQCTSEPYFLDGASKCTLYKMCASVLPFHPLHLIAIYFQKFTRVHTLQICALSAPGTAPCALCALLSIFKAQSYVHIIYSVNFFLYFLQ